MSLWTLRFHFDLWYNVFELVQYYLNWYSTISELKLFLEPVQLSLITYPSSNNPLILILSLSNHPPWCIPILPLTNHPFPNSSVFFPSQSTHPCPSSFRPDLPHPGYPFSLKLPTPWLIPIPPPTNHSPPDSSLTLLPQTTLPLTHLYPPSLKLPFPFLPLTLELPPNSNKLYLL